MMEALGLMLLVAPVALLAAVLWRRRPGPPRSGPQAEGE